jgi:hypothetical protein
VYCLTRETWSADGHYRFSADHVKPKSTHEELTCRYDNLVYCCTQCNGLKSARRGLPDPCKSAIGKHLKVAPDGTFIPKTPLGRRLKDYLRLNSVPRLNDRKQKLKILRMATLLGDEEALRLTLGYPSDLPDLSQRKPPEGNARPQGIQESHYYRKEAGRLPLYY